MSRTILEMIAVIQPCTSAIRTKKKRRQTVTVWLAARALPCNNSFSAHMLFIHATTTNGGKRNLQR